MDLVLGQIAGCTTRYNVGVAQAGAAEEASQVVALLRERLPKDQPVYESPISPALTVHTGPGLLGIFIQPLYES